MKICSNCGSTDTFIAKGYNVQTRKDEYWIYCNKCGLNEKFIALSKDK